MSALATVAFAAVLLALVGLHTVVAAVALRFFRLRLATRWAPVVYTVLAVPLVYVATTLVAFGVLGPGGGPRLGRETLLVFAWVLPLALGVSLDVFWLPPVEEVDLPRQRDGEHQR